MNEIFINLSQKDQELINKFMENLNKKISLTRKETKEFQNDFVKMINFYLSKGKKIDEILEILSLDNLGNCYKEKPTNWYPLDNGAKIYPLSMKEDWMSVYRVSFYLKEEVIPEVLQMALNFTMKRFPTFRTSIRKGFFWNYIDGIKKRFSIKLDQELPCSHINVSNARRQSFKIIYYDKRISLEVFHVLTDGTGASIFLATLVGEYLKLLGASFSYNETVLDINEKPTKEEIIDEFKVKKEESKTKGLIERKALSVDGKLSKIKPCQLLHFDFSLKEIKEFAKLKGATLTEIILTFIFISLSYSTSKEGILKIQVPVNMRKFYKSKTLRNFSLYTSINIERKSIKDFDEVLKEVQKQMQEKTSKESLTGMMRYANRLVNSIKFIPLFIKKPIANFIYGSLSDKSSTTVLSNLGKINVPYSEYINKMDFLLGTTISNKVLFTMISANDILTLSISKFTTNTSIENNLFNLFNQKKLNVKVYGSEVYENRK